MLNLRKQVLVLLLILVSFTFFYGCSSKQNEGTIHDTKSTGGVPLLAVVSIPPQSFFVNRIGRDLVQIEVLAPPAHAAETYQITPRQMDMLSNANVYFRIGIPFEEALVKRLVSTCPTLVIVDTREGVPLLASSGHHHEVHSHGLHEDHTHCSQGNDFHIWLDPMRVKIQAQTIARVLTQLIPEHETTIASHLKAFEEELDTVHGEIKSILEPVRGKTFYVFHPAFGYFADAYGLEQRAIEVEGKSPGPQRLYTIIEEIKQRRTPVIFEQPQFRSLELQAIAKEASISVVQLDDLAPNYFENMIHMAKTLALYLQQPTSDTHL